jgi:hypothetical protein
MAAATLLIIDSVSREAGHCTVSTSEGDVRSYLSRAQLALSLVAGWIENPLDVEARLHGAAIIRTERCATTY